MPLYQINRGWCLRNSVWNNFQNWIESTPFLFILIRIQFFFRRLLFWFLIFIYSFTKCILFTHFRIQFYPNFRWGFLGPSTCFSAVLLIENSWFEKIDCWKWFILLKASFFACSCIKARERVLLSLRKLYAHRNVYNYIVKNIYGIWIPFSSQKIFHILFSWSKRISLFREDINLYQVTICFPLSDFLCKETPLRKNVFFFGWFAFIAFFCDEKKGEILIHSEIVPWTDNPNQNSEIKIKNRPKRVNNKNNQLMLMQNIFLFRLWKVVNSSVVIVQKNKKKMSTRVWCWILYPI